MRIINAKKLVAMLAVITAFSVGMLFSPLQSEAENTNNDKANKWTMEGPQPPTDPSDVVPDSTSHLNYAVPTHPDYKNVEYPKSSKPLSERAETAIQPTPGQADFAADINSNLGSVSGIYAGHQPHTTVSLDEDQFLYAPASQSPGDSSLEAVTAYARFPGQSMERFFGVWDHNTGDFELQKPLNSEFYDTYVLQEDNKDFYYTITEKVSGEWRVLLFNKNTSDWELQWDSTSDYDREEGWNSWESYFNGNCPSLPSIESKNIMVKDGGSWEAVTSTYATEHNSMECSSYNPSWISEYNNWIVE